MDTPEMGTGTIKNLAAGAREDFFDCLKEKMPGYDTANVDPVLTDLLQVASERIVEDIIERSERRKACGLS